MQKLQSSALIEVEVADTSEIDPSVVLGYLPGRELDELVLRIRLNQLMSCPVPTN